MSNGFVARHLGRLALGLALVGLLAPACGQDEGTEPRGGAGSNAPGLGGESTLVAGQSAGGAANPGSAAGQHAGGALGAGDVGGSDAGDGNGAGSGAGPSTSDSGALLGRSCDSDADCLAPGSASGLTCVTDQDLLLAQGSPPGGLCTLPCSSHAVCGELKPGALCFPFDNSADGSYCVEGCYFGIPELGDQKCGSRADFACLPALVADTGEPCAGGCLAGELCTGSTCGVVIPACLPSCRGDLDCPDGLFCDQSFLSGLCVEQAPTGKRLGEPCTVPGPAEPNEPDECLGFCQADAPGSAAGHCSATCGLLSPCAWDAGSGKFDGACYYAASIAEQGFVGDFGFCAPACNCSDECADPTLLCAAGGEPLSTDLFKGTGLCFADDGNIEELAECGAGGMGAGGGSGGAMGGASGDGPSPPGEPRD